MNSFELILAVSPSLKQILFDLRKAASGEKEIM